jgi:hypothetical protein
MHFAVKDVSRPPLSLPHGHKPAFIQLRNAALYPKMCWPRTPACITLSLTPFHPYEILPYPTA